MFNVFQMDPIPANTNPFKHDLFHMGTEIASNLMVMYATNRENKVDYVILVNTETGERIRIALNEKGIFRSLPDKIMNGL